MSTETDTAFIIKNSDLKEMYYRIGDTWALPTNSFKEKAKKVGALAVGIIFLIGALIAHPFNGSNKISNRFEDWFLTPDLTDLVDTLYAIEASEQDPPPIPAPSGPYLNPPPSAPPNPITYPDTPPPSYEFPPDQVEIDAHLRYQKMNPKKTPLPPEPKDPKIWDSTRLGLNQNHEPFKDVLYVRPEPCAHHYVFGPRLLSPEERQAREDRYVRGHLAVEVKRVQRDNAKLLRSLRRGPSPRPAIQPQVAVPSVPEKEPRVPNSIYDKAQKILFTWRSSEKIPVELGEDLV